VNLHSSDVLAQASQLGVMVANKLIDQGAIKAVQL
jgi:hypothetical protein